MSEVCKKRMPCSRNTYVCRRIRLYSYLTEQGFKPYKVVPDIYNADRVVWLYEDSDGKVTKAVGKYYELANETSR